MSSLVHLRDASLFLLLKFARLFPAITIVDLQVLPFMFAVIKFFH